MAYGIKHIAFLFDMLCCSHGQSSLFQSPESASQGQLQLWLLRMISNDVIRRAPEGLCFRSDRMITAVDCINVDTTALFPHTREFLLLLRFIQPCIVCLLRNEKVTSCPLTDRTVARLIQSKIHYSPCSFSCEESPVDTHPGMSHYLGLTLHGLPLQCSLHKIDCELHSSPDLGIRSSQV